MLDNGIKNGKEDDGRVRISLVDSSEEPKRFGGPILGHYLPLEFAVEIRDVIDDFFRDIVVSETDGNEGVADTSKGVLEIIGRDVHSFLVMFGMLDNFRENRDMFNASIDTFNEGFLRGVVNITIGDKKCSESLSLENVIWFSKATSERDHSKIGCIVCITTLVYKNGGAVGPDVRGHAGQVQLVVQGGQEVVCGGEVGQDPIHQAILTRGGSGRFLLHDIFDVTWSER